MNGISYIDYNDAFFSLVQVETVEEFLIEKELFGLNGPFDGNQSREIVTTLIVRHKNELAESLYKFGIFTVDFIFVNDNRNASHSRQSYINRGMDDFIAKYYIKHHED